MTSSHIIEFLTVNIAVESLAASVPTYQRLGLGDIEPVQFPDPPIEMTDVSMCLPGTAALSLIEPWSGGGPVGKFINRRGPGVYSIAFRVDDLVATMHDWSAAGFSWVSPAPVAVPGGRAGGYAADQAAMNWLPPKSVDGVLIEVFELTGNVRLLSSPDESR